MTGNERDKQKISLSIYSMRIMNKQSLFSSYWFLAVGTRLLRTISLSPSLHRRHDQQHNVTRRVSREKTKKHAAAFGTISSFSHMTHVTERVVYEEGDVLTD